MPALARYAIGGLGLAACFFAVHQWVWFISLTPSAHARRCGNCLLGAVGIPLELGALGVLAVVAPMLRVSYRAEHAVELVFVAFGILLTPAVIGVPIFAVGFLFLSYPLVVALFQKRCVTATQLVREPE